MISISTCENILSVLKLERKEIFARLEIFNCLTKQIITFSQHCSKWTNNLTFPLAEHEEVTHLTASVTAHWHQRLFLVSPSAVQCWHSCCPQHCISVTCQEVLTFIISAESYRSYNGGSRMNLFTHCFAKSPHLPSLFSTWSLHRYTPPPAEMTGHTASPCLRCGVSQQALHTTSTAA